MCVVNKIYPSVIKRGLVLKKEYHRGYPEDTRVLAFLWKLIFQRLWKIFRGVRISESWAGFESLGSGIRIRWIGTMLDLGFKKRYPGTWDMYNVKIQDFKDSNRVCEFRLQSMFWEQCLYSKTSQVRNFSQSDQVFWSVKMH